MMARYIFFYLAAGAILLYDGEVTTHGETSFVSNSGEDSGGER